MHVVNLLVAVDVELPQFVQITLVSNVLQTTLLNVLPVKSVTTILVFALLLLPAERKNAGLPQMPAAIPEIVE